MIRHCSLGNSIHNNLRNQRGSTFKKPHGLLSPPPSRVFYENDFMKMLMVMVMVMVMVAVE